MKEILYEPTPWAVKIDDDGRALIVAVDGYGETRKLITKMPHDKDWAGSTQNAHRIVECVNRFGVRHKTHSGAKDVKEERFLLPMAEARGIRNRGFLMTQDYVDQCFDPYRWNRQENDSHQATLNKDVVLETTPHYSDERFKQEQTVFGSEPNDGQHGHKHLHYSYSDRLWQFDYNKAQKATEIANQSSAAPKSCRWYEAYLSAHFGRSVEIEHIIAGVNRSNGYP